MWVSRAMALRQADFVSNPGCFYIALDYRFVKHFFQQVYCLAARKGHFPVGDFPVFVRVHTQRYIFLGIWVILHSPPYGHCFQWLNSC